MSGLGDPASSYATADIALEVIGARKPHRHDKAETPPENTRLNIGDNIVFVEDSASLVMCSAYILSSGS
jgi:hypothetical protein